MKKINAILATAAFLSGAAIAGSANAAVDFTFTAGASAPTSGAYTVVQSFDSAPYTGLTGTYIIHAGTPNNGQGIAPNSSGTSYLSLLAGNTATYTFANPTSSIQFDWGTAASTNLLTVYTTTGNFTYTVPNSTTTGANFNQNGLLTATATTGLITALGFSTTSNAFEIDNISAAVPEPASWAMMVLGFGVIGSAARRRKTTTLSFA